MIASAKHLDFMDPDYLPIIIERMDRLKHLRTKEGKKALPALLKYYKDNCIEFINDWMVTYDPRVKPSYRPFILFKCQEEYIEWIIDKLESKEDGLVEKSRDMGATWLNMAFAIWAWRFHEIKVGFGSRKETLVDRLGDPDSIFEKGRMILDRLPYEFLPNGFSAKDHLGFMKFINPENGSTITGEAGDNIGRGGRNTVYFKDESAFYMRPMLIEASLSQNSDVKIDVSTPNGVGNLFHQKATGGVIDKFVLDWKDDPRRDQAWYKKQVAKLDSIIVAQEIDRDYGASVEGLIIPAKWVQAAIELDIDSSGMRRAGLDVADEGADSNALAIAYGSVLKHIEEWKKGNTTQTARRAAHTCGEHECYSLRYDKIGVGAGVKGELAEQAYKHIKAIGIHSGSSPTPGMYEESEKSNKDFFLNFRAQMWWLLRRRFEKTYEHVNKIEEHSYEEMISIPNDYELITELSIFHYKFTSNGKIQVEKKEDAKKRGFKSPNKADAVCMAFAPVYIKRAGTFRRSKNHDLPRDNQNTERDVTGTVGAQCGTFRRKKLRLTMGAR